MAFIEKRDGEIPKLTESMVQDLLAGRAQRLKHELIVPNTGVAFGWESDLISVMKNGFTHEYEIKVSRADWLAELRKVKAERSDTWHNGAIRWPNVKSMRHAHLTRAKKFEAAINAGKTHHWGGYLVDGCYARDAGPNYFWLVTADNVVKPDELPDYAGHMIVAWDDFLDGYKIKESRPAPRQHRLKIGDRALKALARGLSLRFWESRRLEAQRRG